MYSGSLYADDESSDAVNMQHQMEDAQAHISNLLEMLAIDNFAEESYQVTDMINSMENMLGTFSNNHYDLQTEMSEVLESSRHGLLTHTQLADLMSTEATRSHYVVSILDGLRLQIESMHEAMQELKELENIEATNIPSELAVATKKIALRIDTMMKSVNSINKVVLSPTKRLSHAIATLDSEVVMHVNKTKLDENPVVKRNESKPPSPKHNSTNKSKGTHISEITNAVGNHGHGPLGAVDGQAAANAVLATLLADAADASAANSAINGATAAKAADQAELARQQRTALNNSQFQQQVQTARKQSNTGLTSSSASPLHALKSPVMTITMGTQTDHEVTLFPTTSSASGTAGQAAVDDDDMSIGSATLTSDHEDDTSVGGTGGGGGGGGKHKKGHKKGGQHAKKKTSHAAPVSHSKPIKTTAYHSDDESDGNTATGNAAGMPPLHPGKAPNVLPTHVRTLPRLQTELPATTLPLLEGISSVADLRSLADDELSEKLHKLQMYEETEMQRKAELERDVRRRVKQALVAATTRDYSAFAVAIGSKSPLSRSYLDKYAQGELSAADILDSKPNSRGAMVSRDGGSRGFAFSTSRIGGAFDGCEPLPEGSVVQPMDASLLSPSNANGGNSARPTSGRINSAGKSVRYADQPTVLGEEPIPVATGGPRVVTVTAKPAIVDREVAVTAVTKQAEPRSFSTAVEAYQSPANTHVLPGSHHTLSSAAPEGHSTQQTAVQIPPPITSTGYNLTAAASAKRGKPPTPTSATSSAVPSQLSPVSPAAAVSIDSVQGGDIPPQLLASTSINLDSQVMLDGANGASITSSENVVQTSEAQNYAVGKPAPSSAKEHEEAVAAAYAAGFQAATQQLQEQLLGGLHHHQNQVPVPLPSSPDPYVPPPTHLNHSGSHKHSSPKVGSRGSRKRGPPHAVGGLKAMGANRDPTQTLDSFNDEEEEENAAEAQEFRKLAEMEEMKEKEALSMLRIDGKSEKRVPPPSKIEVFNKIFDKTKNNKKKIEMIRIRAPEFYRTSDAGTCTAQDGPLEDEPQAISIKVRDHLHQGAPALSASLDGVPDDRFAIAPPNMSMASWIDLSASDTLLPGKPPPGSAGPPDSAPRSDSGHGSKGQGHGLIRDADIDTIKNALYKALDPDTSNYLLGQLNKVLILAATKAENAAADRAGIDSPAPFRGTELPIYDNQGGILLTRTYKPAVASATFAEKLSQSDNPLLFIYQEFQSFIPRVHKTRLLNACVMEERIKDDLMRTNTVHLLLQTLLENMMISATECSQLTSLVTECEKIVSNMVGLLKRKPEYIGTVLESPQMLDLYSKLGEIDALQLSVDLSQVEYRAMFERINKQSLHEIENLMKESADFEYCYKHFLACQAKMVGARQRLHMIRDRCKRYDLGRGLDRKALEKAAAIQPQTKKVRIEFDDQLSTINSSRSEMQAAEVQALRDKIEELTEQLKEANEEFEDQEVEMMQVMEERDRSPDALLFFAIMHDPSYIQNLQQVALQLKHLRSFADGTAHMDFLTLRKRVQVCTVLIPSVEKLVERYNTMYKKWSSFRLNWFSARKLNGGSADAFNSCPLCFQSVSAEAGSGGDGGGDDGSAIGFGPHSNTAAKERQKKLLSVTGMDRRSMHRHEIQQKQTQERNTIRQQILSHRGPGSRDDAGLDELSSLSSPGKPMLLATSMSTKNIRLSLPAVK